MSFPYANNLFYSTVILTVSVGYLMGALLSSHKMSELWALGFGKVGPGALIGINFSTADSLLPIFIANSPQIVLSWLYLTTNGLLTTMLLADEWSQMAHHRSPLRVTSPKGKQRSTYRLQIPYSYGIPLLAIFGCLHWLVSQSLFLARIDVYDIDDLLDEAQSVSTCGYSIMALILALSLAFVILVSTIAVSFRRLRLGIPMASDCSAAISAACHPPRYDSHASQEPVQWGEVADERKHPFMKSKGHCTITSFKVYYPIKGRRYAG